MYPSFDFLLLRNYFSVFSEVRISEIFISFNEDAYSVSYEEMLGLFTYIKCKLFNFYNLILFINQYYWFVEQKQTNKQINWVNLLYKKLSTIMN